VEAGLLELDSGILGQQMLYGNSEMLHISDLIFAIKGLNLNFRKG